MKKLISVLTVISILSAFCWQNALADELIPPQEDMLMWVSAGEGVEQNSGRINKWTNKSNDGNSLLQSVSNRCPSITESEKLKTLDAVHFTKNRYLLAENINYSGDATFILYYTQSSTDEGNAIFSSHSFARDHVAESGKVPFSIVNSQDKTLAFKMQRVLQAEETEASSYYHDMNVSVADMDGNYMALYLTIESNTKKVNVYAKPMNDHTEITTPVATFTLEEVPYWESIAYNLNYNVSEIKGVIADYSEAIIYKRALSLDELNDVNKYLKVKHEYPVIEKLKLRSDISEIQMGEDAQPEVIGIGTLMGTEIETQLESATITSSDSSVIKVEDNKLKAISFGDAVITVSYPGTENYTFVVNVPRVRVYDAVIGDIEDDGEVSCSRKVENLDSESNISAVMAVTLYKGDELIDIKFEQAEIETEHTFSVGLTLPEITQDYRISAMILSGDGLAPLAAASLHTFN